MFSSNDVRDIRFSKAMGGYKQEEVDNFLDGVEDDYRQYEAHVKNLEGKVNALSAEIEEYKTSQASLQNVLISAQQLADNIINDAKIRAEKILEDAKLAADVATGEAKSMLINFDEKLAEKRAAAQVEMDKQFEKAEAKRTATEKATEDAVKRQQALFDKLRIEVSSFKSDLMELYKKHIELISKMPDCVAMDATRAAEAVALEIERLPDVGQFVETESVTDEVPEVIINLENEDQDATEEAAEQIEIAESAEGFVVEAYEDEEAVEDDEEEIGFTNSFFGKNK